MEIIIPENYEEAPEVVKVTVVNRIEFEETESYTPDTEKLPGTGENPAGMLSGLAGLMLIAFGAYELVGRRKSKGNIK